MIDICRYPEKDEGSVMHRGDLVSLISQRSIRVVSGCIVEHSEDRRV